MMATTPHSPMRTRDSELGSTAYLRVCLKYRAMTKMTRAIKCLCWGELMLRRKRVNRG